MKYFAFYVSILVTLINQCSAITVTFDVNDEDTQFMRTIIYNYRGIIVTVNDPVDGYSVVKVLSGDNLLLDIITENVILTHHMILRSSADSFFKFHILVTKTAYGTEKLDIYREEGSGSMIQVEKGYALELVAGFAKAHPHEEGVNHPDIGFLKELVEKIETADE